MIDMRELSGAFPEEIAVEMASLSEKPFRARQVFDWLQKGVPFDGMTNLPNSLREKLKANYVDLPVRLLEKRISQLDDTVKVLYSLPDGNCVEGVIMHYHYGYTLCISTQVGCAMGCRFCASTLDGCVRNLSAAEMIGQIYCANELLKEKDARIGHVVLMGSGEPLMNMQEVIRFLRLVSHPQGLNISIRHISLSTCGLVPKMYEFADSNLPVTLSLSLHAPNDRIRRKLMPVAERYSIRETLDACQYYLKETGRRFIIEYALIDGINASCQNAEELSSLLRGMQCHVNVIPLNEVPERQLFGVKEAQVQAFLNVLEKNHISATRRREMGDDIQGACGQLRKHHLEVEA